MNENTKQKHKLVTDDWGSLSIKELWGAGTLTKSSKILYFIGEVEKMKQIVAWVNKWDRKHLEKYQADIYFALDIDDFEFHLEGDILPLFSLNLAGRNIKKISKIIVAHSELRFYFLDKRTKNWNLENKDWKVRNFDNAEGSTISHQEAIHLSYDPPIIPERILETNRLFFEATLSLQRNHHE